MKRRDFLTTSTGVVGASLSNGLILPAVARDTSAPKPTEKVPVGVARGSNMEEAVTKAVEMAGGMDFIKEGQTVLIKPNCTGAKKNPTTTSAEALYATIKLVNEHGPRRIIVADRPFSPLMLSNPEKALTSPNSLEVMKAVGHIDAVEQAKSDLGAPVIARGLEDAPAEMEALGLPKGTPHWRRIKLPQAKHWPNGYELAELLLAVDHVINLPVLKTHFQAWFTMSLKAFVGMSHHRTRLEFHSSFRGSNSLFDQKAAGRVKRRRGMKNHTPQKEYDQVYGFVARIAELNLGFAPAMNILDGTESYVFGGPSSGDSVQPKLAVASRDRIAADALGVSVLRYHGTESRLQKRTPWETPFLRHAIKLGLGIDGPDKMDVQSSGVDEIKDILAYLVA